jgi:hypothetical protein
VGFGTLGFDHQRYLEEQRWLFLNSRARAQIFVATGGLFIVLFLFWHWLDGDALLVGSAESIGYGPIEIHKKFHSLDDDSYTILLLGGSTSRELTYSDRFLSESVSQLCQRKVSFINAGSSSQTYIASRSIYDLFSKKGVDLVVIGANLYRYILSPSGIHKNALFNQLSIPISAGIFFSERGSSLTPPPLSPVYTGAYLAANKSLIAQFSLGRSFAIRDKFENSKGLHNLYVTPSRTIKYKERIARQYLLQNYLAFKENANFGASRWNDFFEQVMRDGAEVVVLDLPVSPTFLSTERFFRDQYDEILKSHNAIGAGVVRWSASDLGLIESDFFDQQHLLASGRQKIEPALLLMIQDHIPECH